MNAETWQRLLSLETRDVVSQWFFRIHSRELNARRAKEIIAAAKQAREYFANAARADYSVRPLLAFYGVVCLSRSLTLLLRGQGGEEGLTTGHGLETVDWGSIMSGDTGDGLRSLSELRIRKTAGLFSDFVVHTENRISMHVNSSRVDWHICYDIPAIGDEVCLADLFSRIPDLHEEYTDAFGSPQYASVGEMTYNGKSGFTAKVGDELFSKFQGVYESYGYSVTSGSPRCTLKAGPEIFEAETPQFVHTYIHKNFGSIPSLYLAVPFPSGARYSQLCITYMLSYFLGMLVRYYPTHWVSLIQGERGDIWWPTINRAQQLIENSYPELIIELTTDVVEKSASRQLSSDGAEESA